MSSYSRYAFADVVQVNCRLSVAAHSHLKQWAADDPRERRLVELIIDTLSESHESEEINSTPPPIPATLKILDDYRRNLRSSNRNSEITHLRFSIPVSLHKQIAVAAAHHELRLQDEILFSIFEAVVAKRYPKPSGS